MSIRFCELCLMSCKTGDEPVDEGKHVHRVDETHFFLICDRHESIWQRVKLMLRRAPEGCAREAVH